MTLLESPARAPGKSIGSHLALIAKIGPMVALVLLFTLFSLIAPKFGTRQSLELMFMETAIVGTAALGMTIIIVSGGIDLSVGSTIALTTVVVALLINAGYPALLSAVGGVVAAAACGLIIGLLVTGFRLAPFIVTLGTWGAYRGMATGLAHKDIIRTPDTWLNDIMSRLPPDKQWHLAPSGVWTMVVLAIIVAALLRYTRFGRHVFAVGSNEQTARLCGINVNRSKVLIYVLGGAFAGMAGVLEYGKLAEGDPTAAQGMELNIIAAVVIGGASLNGGQGSVMGTLVGALLMVVVSTGCNKMSIENWTQEIITGGIIILAAAIDQLQHRRSKS